jgi:uncharacterized membrane protein YukC
MMACSAGALLLHSAPHFTEDEIIVDFSSRIAITVPSPARLTSFEPVRGETTSRIWQVEAGQAIAQAAMARPT